MKRFFAISMLLFAAVSMMSVPAAFSAEGQAASGTLHTFIDTLKAMQFPIADPVKHAGQVKQANAAVDLESMGQKALGPHWAKMDAAQQKEFMELLWKLIENIAYPRSNSFFGSAPIEFQEPKSLAKGFEITTIVKNEDEALNAPIVYNLYEQGGQWKIYDIFLDGVTITEDLKFQFDKIIQESSYPGLLQRMRERLAKAEEANKKK